MADVLSHQRLFPPALEPQPRLLSGIPKHTDGQGKQDMPSCGYLMELLLVALWIPPKQPTSPLPGQNQ